MRHGSWSAVLAWAWILASCAESAHSTALRLLEFRQRDLESVALNEELTFYFSAPLDPSSITSDSLRVLDEEGVEARGERRVRGNALSFLPALPCASDLSDGGFRPGQRYRVVLGGFPRPDGIRSASGALLSAGLVVSFRTAGIGGTSPLFLDPFRGPFRLQPRGRRGHAIELDEGLLVLEYGEALDPSSVPGSRFELKRSSPGTSELEPLPTVARLIENRRDHAALRIERAGPDGLGGGRLPPGTYYLSMPGRELRTLGGRAVEPGWLMLELSVPQARVVLDLGAVRTRSDEPPPACDGTAHWNETGAGLRLRYPAAAGSGAAGALALAACPELPDLQATRLVVEAASTVDLSGRVGPVVLRSQTSIEIRGRLERRGPGAQHDPLTLELERAASLPRSQWAPLGPWVERLLAPDQPWSLQPWTVLIAGGDIRVPDGGAIEVEGPLVLVAGGWIRVEGLALAHGNLWRTPGGGGRTAAHGRNTLLPLELDEPRVNPLRTSLVVGALTQPFPWTPRGRAWRMLLVGREGGGRVDARFLQVPPGGSVERLVGDPSELVAGLARALLRLESGPGDGDPWDPPRLERLELEAVPALLDPGPERR